MVPLPQSVGPERVVEILILPYKRRNLPSVSFRGNGHLPLASKSGNPDEGASNEVSSLANEKFISSRNKYGLVGKQYLLALVCFHTKIWCIFTPNWKPNIITFLTTQWNYILLCLLAELYSGILGYT